MFAKSVKKERHFLRIIKKTYFLLSSLAVLLGVKMCNFGEVWSECEHLQSGL